MFDRFRKISKRFKQEIKLYKLVLQDKRTPKIAKILLGLTIGYSLLPFDIIPDFIPVLGYLDDLIILPLLLFLALQFIPKEIIDYHRRKITMEKY